jgi:predicted nucleic acid-binding Zn ribbon protein
MSKAMTNISAVLNDIYKKAGIEKPIEQHKAFMYWDDIVGVNIKKVAQPKKIENDILIVEVDSPVWRNELMFLKQNILQKLNQKLKGERIKEIRFL